MIEQVLVLEDVHSQLRVVSSSIQHSLAFISVVSGQGVVHCEDIFSKNKVLPAIILADFSHYKTEHMHLLREIRASRPLIPMLALVPFGDKALKQALYAMGICEVLFRPIEVDELVHRINSQLIMQRMSSLIMRLERKFSGKVLFGDLVGYSSSLKQAIARAQQLAGKRVVMIEGEVGTGKTLLARAMHGAVAADQEFLFVDCEREVSRCTDVMPLPTIEGLGVGTLYLREVRYLTKKMQEQFLSWLRLNEVSSGGVSLICTSSVRLQDLVKDNLFDPELCWLLCRNSIVMPSLYERREDIAKLAQHFLAMHTARNNKFINRFSDDALRMLANADWPGNVTQLSNLVYRCCMLCNHDVIDAGTLRLVQQLEPVHYARQANGISAGMPSMLDAKGKIKKLKSIEEEAIQYVLSHSDGSMTKAAASLGIGRSTLYRRITGKEPQMLRANQTTRPMMRMSSTDFS